MPHDRREPNLPSRGVSRRDFLETTSAAAVGAAAFGSDGTSAPSLGAQAAPAAGESRGGLLYPQQNQHRNLLDLSGSGSSSSTRRRRARRRAGSRRCPRRATIAVPCSWNDLFDDARDYLGLAWYRTEVWVPAGLARAARVPARRLGELRRQGVGQRHAGGRAPRRAPAVRRRRHRPARVGPANVDRHRGREQAAARTACRPGRRPARRGVRGLLGGYPATTYDFFPYAGLHRPVLLYSVPGRRTSTTSRCVTTLDGSGRRGEGDGG